VVGAAGFGAVGIASAIVWSLYGTEPEVAPPGPAPVFAAGVDDAANASASAVPSPDVAKGRVTLPPPTDAQPWRGPRDAPVVVQVFGDLQCPYTKKVVPLLERLVLEFPRKVMLVYRNYPQPFHKLARPAARVALAAFRQKGSGVFWEIRERIQRDVGSPRGFVMEGILRHAAELGVEAKTARRAFDGNDALDEVLDADIALARQFGFDSTPTTVVNGIVIRGAQPAPDYENAVRQALEELAARSADAVTHTVAAPWPHEP
jgi:protein-disulfide isomerase